MSRVLCTYAVLVAKRCMAFTPLRPTRLVADLISDTATRLRKDDDLVVAASVSDLHVQSEGACPSRTQGPKLNPMQRCYARPQWGYRRDSFT